MNIVEKKNITNSIAVLHQSVCSELQCSHVSSLLFYFKKGKQMQELYTPKSPIQFPDTIS